MKIWKYVIAPLCILIAVFGILEATSLIPPIHSFVGEISPLRICGAILVFAFFLKYLLRLKICRAVFSLSILFMILEPNIAYLCGVESGNIINNWLLLFYTLLICIGLWLILTKRRRKWSISAVHNGHHENSLGSRTIYIDCSTFTDRDVENNLGSTVIRFENTDAYIGSGLLRLENNLGSTVVEVPRSWSLDCQIENNLGSVQNHVGIGGNGPSLMISGENNLGSIVIRKS